MRYKVEVIINKPREFVIKEIRSIDAAFKWMEGLQSFDLIEGKDEEVDSKYEMVFMNKGRKEVMIETVKEFNPPSRITMLYEMGAVGNLCINDFEDLGSKTRYIMETEFKFGFPWILFAWAFKGMFKKNTLKGMMDFKNYCESL